MARPSFFSTLTSVNPALSACVGEIAEYLAAPDRTRLSEEQRALSLGVARRLVDDAATMLGTPIDSRALWQDWSEGGLPGAAQLAPLCFARAEEHRWRDLSLQQDGEEAATLFDTPVDAKDAVPSAEGPRDDAPVSDIDRAYLSLRIADGRRFDALGHPCIAIDDLDSEQLRMLLLDIAAWQLVRSDKDAALAAQLGDTVRSALARHNPARGIDHAAARYHAALSEAGTLCDSAAAAIARHDWPTLIALAAAAQHCRYGDVALALITAEPAQLAPLLTRLLRDQTALGPLEGSLARLPNRATVSAISDDHSAALKDRAAGSRDGTKGRKG